MRRKRSTLRRLRTQRERDARTVEKVATRLKGSLTVTLPEIMDMSNRFRVLPSIIQLSVNDSTSTKT